MHALWAIAATLPIAASAVAENSPYRIEELFSSADGKLQFVQLVNVDRNKLAGATLTTTDGSTTKAFTFPTTPHFPEPPRTEYVLIISQSLSERTDPSVWVIQWDYVMPDGFLPVNGGTIILEGIERWDFRRVPTDGFSALYQPGEIGVHQANSSAGGYEVRFGLDDFRFVFEYANAASDRHFLTTDSDERGALNSGKIAGWHLIYQDFVPEFGDYTGFAGFGRPVEVSGHPVCRFYLPPPADSHFFTASEAECADVQSRFPNLILETDNAFYAGLPDPVSGACARGTEPVYRLWNPTSNDHWFTADEGARSRALAQGYVPEGYGQKGVAMCSVALTCYTC